ncbi:MAG: hypothetical protein J2P48_08350 [Alphaproteobacteria bacterium]|nr:hypothetical protein [Alphaproteobacteria bacterium]
MKTKHITFAQHIDPVTSKVTYEVVEARNLTAPKIGDLLDERTVQTTLGRIEYTIRAPKGAKNA